MVRSPSAGACAAGASLKGDSRAGDTQPQLQWHMRLDGGASNSIAVEKDPVARMQILHPPLPVFEGNLHMLAADIFMLDRDLTLIRAADLKSGCELAHDGRHDIVNRDAEDRGRV